MATDLVLPLPGYLDGEGDDCGDGAPYAQPRAQLQQRQPGLGAWTQYQTQPADDPAVFSRQRVDLLMDYYKQISTESRPAAEEYPLPLKKQDMAEEKKVIAIEASSKAANGRRRTKKKASEGDSHDETASTTDTRGSESTDANSGGSQDDSQASKMGRWRSRGGSRSSSSSQKEKESAGGGAGITVDALDKHYKPKKSRSFRTSRLSSRQRQGASSRTRSLSKKGGRRRRGRDASPSAGSHSTASTESVHSADSSSLESNFSVSFNGAAGSRSSASSDGQASGARSRDRRGGHPDDDLRRRMREQQRRRRGAPAAQNADRAGGDGPGSPPEPSSPAQSDKGRGVNSFIRHESETIARDAMDLVRHHIERSLV